MVAFTSAGGAPLAGRTRELAALLDRLDAASDGAGGLILLAGEPGIGKTRLLAELAAHARAAGWCVLSGRAHESEGLPAYLPIVEAFRPYVRACPPDLLVAQLGEGAASIARILPELAQRLPALPDAPSLSPEHERYRLFESVADFMTAIAGRTPPPTPPPAARGEGSLVRAFLPAQRLHRSDRRPAGLVRAASQAPLSGEAGEGPGEGFGFGPGLLLVLDDLHWADRPMLALLQHLAHRIRSAPILIAGTHRAVEIDRTHPLASLLAELRRERLADRITLSGLSLEEIAALIAGLTGTPPAPTVAATIARETKGNPFFVEEVVRQLMAEGQDLADAGVLTGTWQIPEGIREVLAARLNRLSAAANHVLQTAAVLGEGFSFDVLAAAMELEPVRRVDLLDALDETLLAGVLREAGEGYSFSHPLIRQAIYDELRLYRRRILHLRAAQALESAGGAQPDAHIAAIATHLRLAGTAADPAMTAAYLCRAATAASAMFAWEEAALHWQAALDLLPEEDRAGRAAARLGLGEAQLRAGALPESKATLERAARLARAIADPDLLARIALSYGVGEETGGAVDQTTLSLLEEARAALGEQDSPSRARVLARLAWQQLLPEWLERRRSLSAEAVQVARRVGEPRTLAYALNARHWGLRGPDTLDARLAVGAEIVAVSRACGDLEMEMAGHLWQVMDLLETGDLPAAEAAIAAYTALAERAREPYFTWYAPLFQAMRALLDGRLDDADQLSRTMIEIGRHGQPILADVHHRLVMALIAEIRGHPQQAIDHFTPIVEAFPYNPVFETIIALWLAQAGDRQAAIDYVERSAGFAAIVDDDDWLSLNAWAARVCAELADARLAARLYAALLPYAGRFPVIANAAASLGSMEYYLGLLAATSGRRAEALAHLERAAVANERLGARVWLLCGWLNHAALLINGSAEEQQRALRLLERTIEDGSALGLTRLVERAAVLRETAHGPAHAPKRQPGPDGLTERELDVLRLIAGGRTNHEIADQLVLSVRTVERHIAHIYAKTAARGRADATRYAVRHSLVPSADAE